MRLFYSNKALCFNMAINNEQISILFERIGKASWIISLLLLISSIAIVFNLGPEFLVHFEGSENIGATLDQDFLLQFVISFVFTVVALCALVVYKLKKAKLLSKAGLLISLFLITLLCNELLFLALIISFGFVDRLHLGLYLFDLLLLNLVIFIWGTFLYFDKIIRILPKEEEVIQVVNLAFVGSLKRGVLFIIPVLFFFTSLLFCGSDESKNVFLSVIISVLFAIYASMFFTVHLARLVDKLLIFARRRNESKIST